MASYVAPTELLEGRRLPLDVRQIEDEFTRMWDASARAGGEPATIRLRVMNFVAIASDEGGVRRFEDVMQVMPERHPCRGVLVYPAGGKQPPEATISARCWLTGGGGRHVCSEEVILRGPSTSEPQLTSALLALLVPDVPVVAWLIGPPPTVQAPLLAEVLEVADRVLSDTTGVGDLGGAYRAVQTMASEHDILPSDIAWGRLATWRALIAQLFDGDDGARRLAGIESIEIAHDARAASEATLLAGWFVSRLALSLADATATGMGLAATLYDGSRGVRLSTRSQEGSGLSEVRLVVPGEVLSVSGHAEREHMHIREDADGEPIQRTVERLPEDEAAIIARTLDDDADPRIYLEALGAAMQLLDAAP